MWMCHREHSEAGCYARCVQTGRIEHGNMHYVPIGGMMLCPMNFMSQEKE